MPDRSHRRGPILEPLRELDAELARSPLSPEAETRLRALFNESDRRARRLAIWIPVGAALAAAVALLLVLRPWRPEPPPARVGGFALIAGRVSPESSDASAVRCQTLHCALAAEELGTDLRLERETTVRRRPGNAIQLLRGAARCIVRRRPPGAAPIRILVSHGAIEVLGTEFELRQETRGGWVKLEEGKIRFRATDGREVLLRPGEQLSWPLPAVRAAIDAGATPSDAGPRQVSPRRRDAGRPLTTEQAESLLDELERMRSQGRYAEVARRLRDALPRISEGAMRERISFELGTVLTQQLRDVKAACAHWRRHLRRFGGKRYGPEIRAAVRELACPEAMD